MVSNLCQVNNQFPSPTILGQMILKLVDLKKLLDFLSSKASSNK